MLDEWYSLPATPLASEGGVSGSGGGRRGSRAFKRKKWWLVIQPGTACPTDCAEAPVPRRWHVSSTPVRGSDPPNHSSRQPPRPQGTRCFHLTPCLTSHHSIYISLYPGHPPLHLSGPQMRWWSFYSSPPSGLNQPTPHLTQFDTHTLSSLNGTLVPDNGRTARLGPRG